MCILFLCPLLHCEINFPLTLMRSWVVAESMLLDLQNCELNKPLSSQGTQPWLFVRVTQNDLRQMWIFGDLCLVSYGIWAGSWFSLTKISTPWYSMALSKSEHSVCMMGHLATEGIECQEESNQRSPWNGLADSRTRKLCGEMFWWFRSHIGYATFRGHISSGWLDWRDCPVLPKSPLLTGIVQTQLSCWVHLMQLLPSPYTYHFLSLECWFSAMLLFLL